MAWRRKPLTGWMHRIAAMLVAFLAAACAYVTPAASNPSPRARPYPDQDRVEIDGGPNRLRIARSYVEPLPPGDIMGERSFALRAILPDMDPAAAHDEIAERKPTSRVVRIGYKASLLAPVHSARTRMAREAARVGAALDDFTPASPATMGWRARLGRNPNGNAYRQPDLFWADLPGRDFVGAECRVGGTDGRRYDPEVCVLHIDWRGAEVYALFSRVWLAEWQSIAAGVLDLLDHHAVEPRRPAQQHPTPP